MNAYKTHVKCQVQFTNTIGSYYCSCDTLNVLTTGGIDYLSRLCIK